MSNAREEHIKLFKEKMCSICYSKYCKQKISVKHKDEVTIIMCNEYNKTRKDQLKKVRSQTHYK